MSSEENLKNNLTSDSLLESKVDILKCISSLSNDEVFTPPHLANEVLDLLPKEIWKDRNVTFLDPCCKTGVFLREITKRLIEGLEEEIPDLQERINHILTKQVFGLAITELTGLVSRRTVYCSKDANSKYSICTEFKEQGNKDVCYKIEDVEINQRYRAVEHDGQYYFYPQEHEGNILYPHTEHEWKNGSCVKCGASQKVQDRGSELESHAYSFIHTDIKELFGDMKFDVIIGNPPYQLKNSGHGASATALYPKFIERAKQLNPRFISMIIPARWYSGKKFEKFRNEMLFDNKLSKLIDFPNSNDCFPGNDIEGGVCYFLWERDKTGECEVTNKNNGFTESTCVRPLKREQFDGLIRYNNVASILDKITKETKEYFHHSISTQKPFGIRTYVVGKEYPFENSIKLYGNKSNKYVSFISENDVTKNNELIEKYKVIISSAYGMGKNAPYQVINKPFISEPGSCCSETYIILGVFDNEEKCQNMISYIQTKFFRFLVFMKKNTQHGSREVYSLVPLQDFSKPWTDEELYKKYNLNDDEINYIESMIKEMDLDIIEVK